MQAKTVKLLMQYLDLPFSISNSNNSGSNQASIISKSDKLKCEANLKL